MWTNLRAAGRLLRAAASAVGVDANSVSAALAGGVRAFRFYTRAPPCAGSLPKGTVRLAIHVAARLLYREAATSSRGPTAGRRNGRAYDDGRARLLAGSPLATTPSPELARVAGS